MIPLALVALIVAIIFVVRDKAWILGACVFTAGILCAATPAGVWVTQNLNELVAWVSGWSLFHR